MGNTPSTSNPKPLPRDKTALTLPLGSKIEQLFYEDFSSDTPPDPPSQKRLSKSQSQPLDKWAPISSASTGFSDPAHLSKQQARQLAHPLHNVPDKPLPAGPPGPDFFSSPLDSLSGNSSGREESSAEASSSKKHDSGTATVETPAESEPVEAKPKVSNETLPSSSTSTTYSAAESRWQERISRRIADRKVSDGVKAGLERTAYLGTGKLGEKEKERDVLEEGGG
ncbi:hypothetical protein PRZ48_011588 [Zasmidium cellare]|uniref:Uncharacterized protein n=1 Tax=Zasmidium cellare TaxID=395010 RepID=A0ABR0E7A3_ZASCE|nr:hypothetical protein PRZ48_011588 [Zasmidium cellare]